MLFLPTCMTEAESRNVQSAKLVVEILSEVERATGEVRLREDEFTMWIVGLSTAAIGLISVVEKFSALPKRQLVIVFLFFLLAVVVGVVQRWITSKVITENRLEFLAARMKVITALSIGEEKGLFNIIEEMKRREWMKTSWEKWMNWVRVVPAALFALGLILMVLVLTLNWKPPC